MKIPKVSIIVPVYNVEKYLRACLDSILAQTFTDWEAVLVDDGSADRSGTICDEYAVRDSRFVVVHKQNEGVAKARITAFEHSKGELITFIDADDYVTPDYLEKLSKPILEQDADMVSCDYYKVEKGELIEPRGKLTGSYENEQIKDFIANHYFYDKTTNGYGMTIFLCTKMIKRSLVLDGLKQGEGLWYAEDQIAVFYILQHCKKLILIPDRLYYYVQHIGQAMKKYDFSLWKNIMLLMDKYKELDSANLAEDGRRKRTWYHINFTIAKMVTKKDMSWNTFCHHLRLVREMSIMKVFFQPRSINLCRKEKLKYWMLKYSMYRTMYLLRKCRL